LNAVGGAPAAKLLPDALEHATPVQLVLGRSIGRRSAATALGMVTLGVFEGICSKMIAHGLLLF
jgi:hypothetical protein